MPFHAMLTAFESKTYVITINMMLSPSLISWSPSPDKSRSVCRIMRNGEPRVLQEATPLPPVPGSHYCMHAYTVGVRHAFVGSLKKCTASRRGGVGVGRG